MRRGTGETPGRPRTGGAALLLAVFALGHLGVMVHQATAQHARCAEHGELVHGGDDEGAEAGGLEAWTERQAPDDSDRIESRPLAAGHEHEHCWVACAAGERLRVRDPAGESDLARLDKDADLQPATAPRALRSALYRIAPKTSPPA